jgi:glyoxylase-like metal-dependent hydrolase (beta-lactamase superfamily II)
MSYFDLNFQERARVIACGVLHDAGGVVRVDPGPSSTLPTLRQSLAAAGIGIADVTAILLTHIHLDHAGATGTLVRENPRLRVYVHEVGAPHMVDPSRLVATQPLVADAMERWGKWRRFHANRSRSAGR